MAAKLDDEPEDCLACSAFPSAHRSRIRTTNGLERLNQELKRRTRVVRIFPNREAVKRLVTALAMEQSEEWVSGRRYLTMDPFREERRRPVGPAPIAYAADERRAHAWRTFTELSGLDPTIVNTAILRTNSEKTLRQALETFESISRENLQLAEFDAERGEWRSVEGLRSLK